VQGILHCERISVRVRVAEEGFLLVMVCPPPCARHQTVNHSRPTQEGVREGGEEYRYHGRCGKNAGQYNTPRRAVLAGMRESEADALRGGTYIEKVILRPSQASSSHHSSPGSLASEKMSVGQRPSQATPPWFFARAGSTANSSSFPCGAMNQYLISLERDCPTPAHTRGRRPGGGLRFAGCTILVGGSTTRQVDLPRGRIRTGRTEPETVGITPWDLGNEQTYLGRREPHLRLRHRIYLNPSPWASFYVVLFLGSPDVLAHQSWV